MDPVFLGIAGMVLFLALMAVGVPIAIASFMVGLGGIFLLMGQQVALTTISSYTYTIVDFNMASIPLFIIMGLFFSVCGVGEEMFGALRKWFGHLPGGLAVCTAGFCAVFGTCTGSSVATTAIMAKLAYPEMRRHKYDRSLAFGVVSASGTLASLIPPSFIIVIYAVMAEQSIGKVLIAGFIPGIISTVIYAAMIVLRVIRNPSLGRPLSQASWKERMNSLRYFIPALVMFAIIVGGIYRGVFTATEAGGMGAMAAFFIVLIARRLNSLRLWEIISETARLTVMVMLILIGVEFLTKFLTYCGLTTAFARLALQFPSPAMTLLLMFFIYLILGMFIGPAGMMMITTPIFVPVIMELGYSPIWFGIITIKVNEVGMITPPIATNVFVAQGMLGSKEISLEHAFRAILPFLACDVFTIVLFLAFPQIVTFLPNMM